MKIAVLGSGGWGTALALVLLENGRQVTLWSHSAEEIAVIRAGRENPLLKGVPIPEGIELTSDMSDVADCEVIVLATPSFAVRPTARQLAPFLRDGAVLVLASKGIEKDTSLRLSQAVEEEVGEEFPVVVLSGPSHAEEVSRHVPTAVVSAGKSRSATELVQDLFMNPHFRVYSSPDVVGVELGAAFKNVIALCAGVCDGMGYGDNTKAMLMTRGLTEVARLGVALGANSETFGGLAGVGDLIVTCTSMHSRNRRCGILIGQGMPVEQALREIGAVVEGYHAAATTKLLADRTGVDMPIVQTAYAALYEGKPVAEAITELMTRAKSREIEDNWLHH